MEQYSTPTNLDERTALESLNDRKEPERKLEDELVRVRLVPTRFIRVIPFTRVTRYSFFVTFESTIMCEVHRHDALSWYS